ncbi:hypothetical protein RCL1_001976 [Eukaryota sp. TZLM3-RCL]
MMEEPSFCQLEVPVYELKRLLECHSASFFNDSFSDLLKKHISSRHSSDENIIIDLSFFAPCPDFIFPFLHTLLTCHLGSSKLEASRHSSNCESNTLTWNYISNYPCLFKRNSIYKTKYIVLRPGFTNISSSLEKLTRKVNYSTFNLLSFDGELFQLPVPGQREPFIFKFDSEYDSFYVKSICISAHSRDLLLSNLIPTFSNLSSKLFPLLELNNNPKLIKSNLIKLFGSIIKSRQSDMIFFAVSYLFSIIYSDFSLLTRNIPGSVSFSSFVSSPLISFCSHLKSLKCIPFYSELAEDLKILISEEMTEHYLEKLNYSTRTRKSFSSPVSLNRNTSIKINELLRGMVEREEGKSVVELGNYMFSTVSKFLTFFTGFAQLSSVSHLILNNCGFKEGFSLTLISSTFPNLEYLNVDYNSISRFIGTASKNISKLSVVSNRFMTASSLLSPFINSELNELNVIDNPFVISDSAVSFLFSVILPSLSIISSLTKIDSVKLGQSISLFNCAVSSSFLTSSLNFHLHLHLADPVLASNSLDKILHYNKELSCPNYLYLSFFGLIKPIVLLALDTKAPTFTATKALWTLVSISKNDTIRMEVLYCLFAQLSNSEVSLNSNFVVLSTLFDVLFTILMGFSNVSNNNFSSLLSSEFNFNEVLNKFNQLLPLSTKSLFLKKLLDSLSNFNFVPCFNLLLNLFISSIPKSLYSFFSVANLFSFVFSTKHHVSIVQSFVKSKEENVLDSAIVSYLTTLLLPEINFPLENIFILFEFIISILESPLIVPPLYSSLKCNHSDCLCLLVSSSIFGTVDCIAPDIVDLCFPLLVKANSIINANNCESCLIAAMSFFNIISSNSWSLFLIDKWGIEPDSHILTGIIRQIMASPFTSVSLLSKLIDLLHVYSVQNLDVFSALDSEFVFKLLEGVLKSLECSGLSDISMKILLNLLDSSFIISTLENNSDFLSNKNSDYGRKNLISLLLNTMVNLIIRNLYVDSSFLIISKLSNVIISEQLFDLFVDSTFFNSIQTLLSNSDSSVSTLKNCLMFLNYYYSESSNENISKEILASIIGLSSNLQLSEQSLALLGFCLTSLTSIFVEDSYSLSFMLFKQLFEFICTNFSQEFKREYDKILSFALNLLVKSLFFIWTSGSKFSLENFDSTIKIFILISTSAPLSPIMNQYDDVSELGSILLLFLSTCDQFQTVELDFDEVTILFNRILPLTFHLANSQFNEEFLANVQITKQLVKKSLSCFGNYLLNSTLPLSSSIYISFISVSSNLSQYFVNDFAPLSINLLSKIDIMEFIPCLTSIKQDQLTSSSSSSSVTDSIFFRQISFILNNHGLYSAPFASVLSVLEVFSKSNSSGKVSLDLFQLLLSRFIFVLEQSILISPSDKDLSILIDDLFSAVNSGFNSVFYDCSAVIKQIASILTNLLTNFQSDFIPLVISSDFFEKFVSILPKIPSNSSFSSVVIKFITVVFSSCHPQIYPQIPLIFEFLLRHLKISYQYFDSISAALKCFLELCLPPFASFFILSKVPHVLISLTCDDVCGNSEELVTYSLKTLTKFAEFKFESVTTSLTGLDLPSFISKKITSSAQFSIISHLLILARTLICGCKELVHQFIVLKFHDKLINFLRVNSNFSNPQLVFDCLSELILVNPSLIDEFCNPSYLSLFVQHSYSRRLFLLLSKTNSGLNTVLSQISYELDSSNSETCLNSGVLNLISFLSTFFKSQPIISTELASNCFCRLVDCCKSVTLTHSALEAINYLIGLSLINLDANLITSSLNYLIGLTEKLPSYPCAIQVLFMNIFSRIFILHSSLLSESFCLNFSKRIFSHSLTESCIFAACSWSSSVSSLYPASMMILLLSVLCSVLENNFKDFGFCLAPLLESITNILSNYSVQTEVYKDIVEQILLLNNFAQILDSFVDNNLVRPLWLSFFYYISRKSIEIPTILFPNILSLSISQIRLTNISLSNSVVTANLLLSLNLINSGEFPNFKLLCNGLLTLLTQIISELLLIQRISMHNGNPLNSSHSSALELFLELFSQFEHSLNCSLPMENLFLYLFLNSNTIFQVLSNLEASCNCRNCAYRLGKSLSMIFDLVQELPLTEEIAPKFLNVVARLVSHVDYFPSTSDIKFLAKIFEFCTLRFKTTELLNFYDSWFTIVSALLDNSIGSIYLKQSNLIVDPFVKFMGVMTSFGSNQSNLALSSHVFKFMLSLFDRNHELLTLFASTFSSSSFDSIFSIVFSFPTLSDVVLKLLSILIDFDSSFVGSILSSEILLQNIGNYNGESEIFLIFLQFLNSLTKYFNMVPVALIKNLSTNIEQTHTQSILIFAKILATVDVSPSVFDIKFFTEIFNCFESLQDSLLSHEEHSVESITEITVIIKLLIEIFVSKIHSVHSSSRGKISNLLRKSFEFSSKFSDNSQLSSAYELLSVSIFEFLFILNNKSSINLIDPNNSSQILKRLLQTSVTNVTIDLVTDTLSKVEYSMVLLFFSEVTNCLKNCSFESFIKIMQLLSTCGAVEIQSLSQSNLIDLFVALESRITLLKPAELSQVEDYIYSLFSKNLIQFLNVEFMVFLLKNSTKFLALVPVFLEFKTESVLTFVDFFETVSNYCAPENISIIHNFINTIAKYLNEIPFSCLLVFIKITVEIFKLDSSFTELLEHLGVVLSNISDENLNSIFELFNQLDFYQLLIDCCLAQSNSTKLFAVVAPIFSRFQSFSVNLIFSFSRFSPLFETFDHENLYNCLNVLLFSLTHCDYSIYSSTEGQILVKFLMIISESFLSKPNYYPNFIQNLTLIFSIFSVLIKHFTVCISFSNSFKKQLISLFDLRDSFNENEFSKLIEKVAEISLIDKDFSQNIAAKFLELI